MKEFGELCVSTLLLIATFAVTAFATATLWNWFVAPLGVPEINFFSAGGISLFFDIFFLKNKPLVMRKAEDIKPMVKGFFIYAGTLAVVLIMGAIAHSFV